jgi:hypothetical protein
LTQQNTEPVTRRKCGILLASVLVSEGVIRYQLLTASVPRIWISNKFCLQPLKTVFSIWSDDGSLNFEEKISLPQSSESVHTRTCTVHSYMCMNIYLKMCMNMYMNICMYLCVEASETRGTTALVY